MDSTIAKWLNSPKRKEAMARVNGQAVPQRPPGVTKASKRAASRSIRSPEQQANVNRRRALYEACFSALAAGKGQVSFARADELAKKVGLEAAAELIRTQGESATVELFASEYWAGRKDH